MISQHQSLFQETIFTIIPKYSIDAFKRTSIINLTCLLWSCLSIYICPSVIYPVRSGVGCVISGQIKIKINKGFTAKAKSAMQASKPVNMVWEFTIIWHSQYWNLGDGTFSALNSSSTLIDLGQISIHIPRVPSSSRHFLSGSRHLQ